MSGRGPARTATGSRSLVQFFTASAVVVVRACGPGPLARYGRMKCARQGLRCGGWYQILAGCGLFDAVMDVVRNADCGNVRGLAVRDVVREKRRAEVVIFTKNARKLKMMKMF